jgi:hypothetical protein
MKWGTQGVGGPERQVVSGPPADTMQKLIDAAVLEYENLIAL